MENSIGKRQLCVEISYDFIALYESLGSEVKHLGATLLIEKKDFQLKERLSDFLKEKACVLSEYEDVIISWVGSNAVLIPSSIFEPKNLENIYLTCFERQPIATDIEYTRISELSIVNVYEIPLWVKSFFVQKFPRVIMQHEYSHQLRGIIKNSFSLHIFVNVYPNVMSIQVVNLNELHYCNAFEVNHINDLIYYLSFALKQLNLLNIKGKINIHLSDLVTFDAREIEALTKEMSIFNTLQIQFDSNKIIKNQLLCV